MRSSIATLDALTNLVTDLQPELVRLAAQIANGDQHEDLFRCLDVIHLRTPPLRERRQDVPVLVAHLIDQAHQRGHRERRVVTDEAMAALASYSWPGDVRELQEVVERMIVGAHSPVIGMEDIPQDIRDRFTADDLYEAIVVRHESFWTTVYPRLINRQVTRSQVREIVSRGLVAAGGRYTEVARLFNVPMPDEYKKFLSFLDHFGCKPSFKDFRGAAAVTKSRGVRQFNGLSDVRAYPITAPRGGAKTRATSGHSCRAGRSPVADVDRGKIAGRRHQPGAQPPRTPRNRREPTGS
jgi:hypothetical protein